MENKNRRSGHCHEMQGRAKPLSLLEWTRTLLSPAIRRSPMSAAVLKCDAPESDPATLECCLFCVASYHFGREALRVTVDAANDIDRRIGSQAGNGSYIYRTKTDRVAIEMTRTTRDEIQGELFFCRCSRNATLSFDTPHASRQGFGMHC